MPPFGPLRPYLDGRYCDAGSDEVFATVDPATGEVLAEVAHCGPEDVDAAVRSAATAFDAWAATPGAERARVLRRAAGLLRDRNDELARLECRDTGKPITEAATVDVASAAECLEYFAGVAATLVGESLDLPGALAYTRREPLGVCAAIGAWNYPLQIAAWKAAPALACGNTVVLKPAELTPLTTPALAEVLTEAGLPPGACNVVHGDARTGAALVAHPAVAKVSLTGEVGTGRAVMAAAADGLKHVTLELGGKSPLLVFDDADLDQAVSGAMLANFFTQGEVCSNGTRVFVQRGLHDAFVQRLAERVATLRVGDPLDPATQVGALISADHAGRVLGFIQRARAAGARLVCGGGRPEDPALAGGAYVEPTVFVDCTDDMEVARDEIFGPVMTVLVFDEEAEAVRRANASRYGLAAGVFTNDLTRAHRVAAALEAGVCWVNSYNVTPVELPFGGVKLSGIGRENGWAAVDHYTQRKSVYVALEPLEDPFAR